jgi:hypothetical protein
LFEFEDDNVSFIKSGMRFNIQIFLKVYSETRIGGHQIRKSSRVADQQKRRGAPIDVGRPVKNYSEL